MTQPLPYHHGDLRRTLLEAAEELLAEKGIGGFTLRECARRAGVSPAAPAHHFGNVTGLLTAVATHGFETLSDAMETAAAATDGSPNARLLALGQAYVAQALQFPGRFRVTFNSMGLDSNDKALAKAGARAYQILVDGVAAVTGAESSHIKPIFVWSVVHGYANLILDHCTPFAAESQNPAEMITQMLDALLALAAIAIAP